MKTIILPGYSSKNKDWAKDAQKNIPDSQVHEWAHWKDLSIKFQPHEEVVKIKNLVGENEINIIAKSIGTMVASLFIKDNLEKVKKIIFCGLPINDLNEDDLRAYKILSDINPEQVVIFQNSLDEHGNFEAVRRFLSQINPNIKIVEKPGSTHDYPYFDEFKEFLK